MVRTLTGYGTGFFVGERANVVTARHVVCKDKPGAAQDEPLVIFVCWVLTTRGYLFNAPAYIVREDSRTDLALLRLMNPEEFPRPLSLDSLTSLSPEPAICGDLVYFDSFRRKPVDGFECHRVHARVKQTHALTDHGLQQRILTLDAESWPGSSGSPVFSRSGKVIGVLTGCHRQTGEAMVRDTPWLWELFGSSQPGSPRRPAATVIPFPAPPPSFAPYTDPRSVPWWSRVHQRLSESFTAYRRSR